MKKLQSLDSSSVQVRLGMCAAALAGTAAAIPQNAEAVVVTNSFNMAVPQTLQGFYLNFLTGAAPTAPATGWDFNPYSNGGTLAFYWNPTPAASNGGVGSGTTYSDLTLGSMVSSASTFIANTGTAATVNLRSTGTHYVGFRFFNEATSAINYGYAVFSLVGTTGFPATLVSYSYENTGGAITVTAVPEPSTNALLAIAALALGAMGVRAWRRQSAAA